MKKIISIVLLLALSFILVLISNSCMSRQSEDIAPLVNSADVVSTEDLENYSDRYEEFREQLFIEEPFMRLYEYDQDILNAYARLLANATSEITTYEESGSKSIYIEDINADGIPELFLLVKASVSDISTKAFYLMSYDIVFKECVSYFGDGRYYGIQYMGNNFPGDICVIESNESYYIISATNFGDRYGISYHKLGEMNTGVSSEILSDEDGKYYIDNSEISAEEFHARETEILENFELIIGNPQYFEELAAINAGIAKGWTLKEVTQ